MSHYHLVYAISEVSEGCTMYYMLGDVWSEDIMDAHLFADEKVAKEYKDFYQLYDAVVESVELD